MSIDSAGLQNALVSYVATLGIFDNVVSHEPKSAPDRTGVSCAIIWMNTRPVQSSGLASVSVRVEFMARVYTSMLQEPQDEIDVRVMNATDQLFTQFISGFTLGGLVRLVDMFGSDGEPLEAISGYIDQDRVMFRSVDIRIPLIVNDSYSEVA